MTNSAFTVTGSSSGGSGTVTSVAVTSNTLDVTGSPITSDGTIDIELPNSIVGENLLWNAAFRLWQRGSSFTNIAGGTSLYTADRWQLQVGGVGNSGGASQVAGPSTGTYMAKVGRTAGNSIVGNIIFAQTLSIDSCIGVAGKKITISVTAKIGANFSGASNQLTIQLYSGTGSTNTSVLNIFTGSNLEINESPVLTGTLATFSFTSANLASDVTQLGFTLHYSGDTNPSGSDDNFYVSNVKIEIGDIATSYQYVPLIEELNRCKFYCNKSFPIDTAPAQNVGQDTGETTFPAVQAGASVQRSQTIPFPTMYAIPTITLFNPANTNAQAQNETRNQDCSSTAVTAHSYNGVEISCTGSGGTFVSDDLGIHWLLEAEIN